MAPPRVPSRLARFLWRASAAALLCAVVVLSRATPVRSDSPLEAEAAELLRLINEDRSRAGLEPLEPDQALSQVALVHARDMMEHGYFGHVSPRTGSPAARAARAGIRFKVLGENLARAASVQQAHKALMASPPHKANVLRAEFRRVGIAIVPGGRWPVLVVEVFADDP